MSKQQFVKWYPVSEDRPKIENQIGLHESESGTTRPILSFEKLNEKVQKEFKEKMELEEKKLKFAQIANQQKRSERVTIEQRMKERVAPEPDENEQSLLVEQTRELLLDFHDLHKKYLKPDYPVTRSARKKYVEEINRFRKSGFIEFVRSVKIMVNSLCSFENVYDKAMFDLEEKEGWFDRKVKEVLEQKNFESAQEVINSVMQIVMQDEIVMHKRRIMSKMK